MSKFSRVKKSRNKWKKSAVERSEKIRYLRRENERLKKDRNKYKSEAKEARKKKKSRKVHPKLW